MATALVRKTPDSPPEETIQERFQRLASVWHRETDYLSSISEANSHPAFQEIVHMGPQVVPLLLRDLEENHSHWFAALHAITGAQPIPKAAAGNIPKMVEAWLHRAKDNGYRC